MALETKLHSVLILLSVLVLYHATGVQAQQFAPAYGRLDAQALLQLVEAAEGVRFRGEVGEVELSLNTPLGERSFSLRPHDIRTATFQTGADGRANAFGRGAGGGVELFKGTSETAADFIRLSIMLQGPIPELGGMLRVNGTTFTLRTDIGDPLAYEIYEVNPALMRQLFLRCGLDTEHRSQIVSERQTRPAGMLIAELATDADYSFVRAEGGAERANAKIIEIVNGVDAIYRAEHGIGIELSFQHAWTEPDPYRSEDANELLDLFADYWTSFFAPQVSFDMAHLWTDASLNGGTIGLAFLGTTCGLFRYSFSKRFPSVSVAAELAAHEIGHNFNAVHDAGCQFPPQWVMCPFQDPSRVNTSFSPLSKDSISSFIAGAQCLELREDLSAKAGNRAPVLNGPGHQVVSEGEILSVTFTAYDADGDSLVFSAPAGLPAGATLGEESGLFSWAPQGKQSGDYEVAIKVSDEFGGDSSLVFTITVEQGTDVAPLLPRHIFPNIDGSGGADMVTYRSSLGTWYSEDPTRVGRGAETIAAKQFGLPEDIPVPADYNGDRVTDRAVFRPRTSTWFIYFSNSGASEIRPFGSFGDLPAPGDYDGDGRADLAVYRPDEGVFLYRSSAAGEVRRVEIGRRGDIPVPCDYTGGGADNIALFRPESAEWIIKTPGETLTFAFGLPNDIPRPADFLGKGFCEPVVWRPSTGEWHFRDREPVQFGLPGDFPLAQDTDGDGAAELTVWRPAGAVWFIRKADNQVESMQFGLPGDLLPGIEPYLYGLRNRFGDSRLARNGELRKVWLYRPSSAELFTVGQEAHLSAPLAGSSGSFIIPADFDGDGQQDVALFQDGHWSISYSHGAVETRAWGLAGDRPLSGDFDGDAVSDLVVFRPDNGSGEGNWYIIRSSDSQILAFPWGLAGDIPFAADFNGDGITDAAVWRESIGTWFVRDGRSGGILDSTQWGLAGDLPSVADVDDDGRVEKIVWRPSSGTWFIRFPDTSVRVIPWGIGGDRPFLARFSGLDVELGVFRPLTGELYFRDVEGATFKQIVGFSRDDLLVGVQPYDPLP